MTDFIQKFKEKNWAEITGWVFFIGLVVAMLTGHYIFNPFIFGFVYYIVYVLIRTLGKAKKQNIETMQHRLILISVIALIYLYFAFNHNVNKRQFVKNFRKKCYSVQLNMSPDKEQLCEEIASDIDTYLYHENDDYER